MAFQDGVSVRPVAFIGLVSVLVTFALVLALQVLYFHQRNALERANLAAEGPPHELTELTSKQQLALTQQGYVDRQQNIVAVGLNRAQELIVTELSAGKSPREVIGPQRLAAPNAEPDAQGNGSASQIKSDGAAQETETRDPPPEKKESSDDD